MSKCVIVEDNAVIREIMTQIVTDLGMVSVECETPTEAVTYCHKENPAVVLLDWDLPSFGALDFLRGAGQLDTRPEIILCATENDHQQFALARTAGARHHLLKPFDKQHLAAKLVEAGILDDSIIADRGEEPENEDESALQIATF